MLRLPYGVPTGQRVAVQTGVGLVPLPDARKPKVVFPPAANAPL